MIVRMGWVAWLAGVLMATAGGTAAAAPATTTAAPGEITRGEYLVRITGCNDCHTPGYGAHGGHADRAVLLTGNGEVFVGPWGTTYPTNLRLLMQQISVQQWIDDARTVKARPPMPWYGLAAMSDADLRAMYAYIHALGPAGKPAPAALPPGQLPAAPYMQLVLPAAPVAASARH